MANVVFSEEWEGWAEKNPVPTNIPRQLEAANDDDEVRTYLANDVIAIGCILGMLQLADGILTSIGVSRFGVGIEGNPLLRALMEEFGHIPTLTLLKSLALMIVVGLTFLAHRLPWIKNAMGVLTCLYLVAAVIPWTYLLFIKPYI